MPSKTAQATAAARAAMPRAAASAEPWLTFLTPFEAAESLTARGLIVTDDVDREHQVAHGSGTGPIDSIRTDSGGWRTRRSPCATFGELTNAAPSQIRRGKARRV